MGVDNHSLRSERVLNWVLCGQALPGCSAHKATAGQRIHPALRVLLQQVVHGAVGSTMNPSLFPPPGQYDPLGSQGLVSSESGDVPLVYCMSVEKVDTLTKALKPIGKHSAGLLSPFVEKELPGLLRSCLCPSDLVACHLPLHPRSCCEGRSNNQ